MKRWLTLRMILMLGTILFVLGGTVAYWETRHFSESEYSTFSNQSIQLASVFARSASVWLIRNDDAGLEFATNMMLAGSGQYVRIEVENVIILDERVSDPEIEALDLSFDLTSSEGAEARATLRQGGLDVVVPLGIPGQGISPAGTVQIGFSDTQAREKVRSHRPLVFGSATGSWLFLMLITVFIARTLSMRSRLAATQSLGMQTDGIIHCGALVIDTETCAVRLSEKDIDLTPKMFELLAFLARNAGKTFSDSDLLAALWADAPYAASGDVKQCVYMLRRRLGIAHPDPKRIIVNVKGFGYKLEPPAEEVLNPD